MTSIRRCAFEEWSIRMPHCAFEADRFKFLITHSRNCRSRCLKVRLRQISGAISLQRLLKNQRVFSATAAHEGVRPIRMEMWIDLAVVTRNSAEMEKHTQ